MKLPFTTSSDDKVLSQHREKNGQIANLYFAYDGNRFRMVFEYSDPAGQVYSCELHPPIDRINRLPQLKDWFPEYVEFSEYGEMQKDLVETFKEKIEKLGFTY